MPVGNTGRDSQTCWCDRFAARIKKKQIVTFTWCSNSDRFHYVFKAKFVAFVAFKAKFVEKFRRGGAAEESLSFLL